MATAPYDEKGLEGEEQIAYKALWEDVKKVRESMVVERPLTLAQTLGSLNINEFRSLDLEGKEVKLGDIFKENKVTMVNVWATFCPPCREELPDIAKLGKEMKEKGVAVKSMWHIGIKDPFAPADQPAAVVDVKNVSVVTL